MSSQKYLLFLGVCLVAVPWTKKLLERQQLGKLSMSLHKRSLWISEHYWQHFNINDYFWLLMLNSWPFVCNKSLFCYYMVAKIKLVPTIPELINLKVVTSEYCQLYVVSIGVVDWVLMPIVIWIINHKVWSGTLSDIIL